MQPNLSVYIITILLRTPDVFSSVVHKLSVHKPIQIDTCSSMQSQGTRTESKLWSSKLEMRSQFRTQALKKYLSTPCVEKKRNKR